MRKFGIKGKVYVCDKKSGKMVEKVKVTNEVQHLSPPPLDDWADELKKALLSADNKKEGATSPLAHSEIAPKTE